MQNIVIEDIQQIVSDISDFSRVLENKKILVAGGKGFLGTYFINTITALNKMFSHPAEILIVDNLITAKDEMRLDELNIKFIQADISNMPSIKNDLDYIIHSASIASPPTYRKFPLKTVDVNYQGTRNLLELAKDKKVKSMLYLSSSEIYGDPDIVPTPESYWGYVSSTGPRACYDESKRLAETISILYNQEFGVPVKIARPFNVYGPYLNLNDGRVLPDFMKSVIERSEIIIHSDGTPSRSFCYVTDAMRAFFRILILAPSGSIFNVGNDEEVPIIEVANRIKKIVNKPINIKLEKSSDLNYTKDNPQRRCPDLTNVKKTVGYFPQVKLDDGLKRLYNWYLGDMK